MSVALLMATIDNMSDVEPSQVKDELTTMFVRMALAMHRNNQEFTQEQLNALSNAVLAFHEDDAVSGNEAETLFHDTYQQVFKQEMQREDDSEDWNGEVDWRAMFTPRKVLVRIAMAAASQDAVNTKAFYEYCRKNNIT